MSWSSIMTKNFISVSVSPVIVFKALFTISRYVFYTQEWFNLAREDASHLCRTLLIGFLVGLLV
jgi:fumarate reductase subunit C